MPRIGAVSPDEARGRTKQLFDDVQNSMGMVPNYMRALATAPSALEAYLGLLNALNRMSIDAKAREAIALRTSGINGCDYCSSVHSALGQRAGLSPEEIRTNLQGHSSDLSRAHMLAFAGAVVEKRGRIDDEDLEQARANGLGDKEITEIVATVATTLFANYFALVAQIEIDFPTVKPASNEIDH